MRPTPEDRHPKEAPAQSVHNAKQHEALAEAHVEFMGLREEEMDCTWRLHRAQLDLLNKASDALRVNMDLQAAWTRAHAEGLFAGGTPLLPPEQKPAIPQRRPGR